MAKSTPPPDHAAPPWFAVLKAAREFKVSFTAAQLAEHAGLVDTAQSRGSQIASAWLSKFVRWGYVIVAGQAEHNSHRPANLYEITKLGRNCEQTEAYASKLTRLIRAVLDLEEARATIQEERAYAALVAVRKQVAEKV